jgi:hypothetical protein
MEKADKPFIWEPSPYTATARHLAKMDENLRVEMRAQELAEKKRGGPRPGSGRPPKAATGNRVNLTVMVSPKTRQRITALREKGVLIGEAVDTLITQLALQHGIE